MNMPVRETMEDGNFKFKNQIENIGEWNEFQKIWCNKCENFDEEQKKCKIFQKCYGDKKMSENLRKDEKKEEEKYKQAIDLLAMSWLDGARTTLKNWNSWTRSIPETQLIPHLDKLARQHSEKIIKEAFAKKDGKTE